MSATINDGGPAFPGPSDYRQDGSPVWGGATGMSLRDWFAGQALAGFMSQPDGEYLFRWKNTETGETRLLGYGSNPAGPNWVVTKTPNEAMAEAMYNYADAMLAARSKGGAA